jgi:hypothetical protein
MQNGKITVMLIYHKLLINSEILICWRYQWPSSAAVNSEAVSRSAAANVRCQN